MTEWLFLYIKKLVQISIERYEIELKNPDKVKMNGKFLWWRFKLQNDDNGEKGDHLPSSTNPGLEAIVSSKQTNGKNWLALSKKVEHWIEFCIFFSDANHEKNDDEFLLWNEWIVEWLVGFFLCL